jgi:superfamily II DNA or RNA helicase
MSNFQSLLDSFSLDNHVRGRQFEIICKWFLEKDPHYASRLEKVWLWDEWPDRWGADCGIDLIARDIDGKTWAIQSKCYAPDNSVTKRDVDSFLSESANESIDFRLLIATTDKVGANSRKTIQRQTVPVSLILLDDLESAPLEWPTSVEDLTSGHRVDKWSPRDHQSRAIEDTVTGLVDRGQMIMACGTGKTLTALWTSEKLEAKRTLVLLPSLLLLSKTLAEWVTHANEPFAYLPVCSDETVSRDADAVMSSTSDLAFPSTTDANEIASFLRKNGTRVIFSTYQSSSRIAEAFKLEQVPEFDLIIADEAHRCAGKFASEYGTVLDNDAIPAQKRLFMTATPRIYSPHLRKKAAESDIDVASMDDESVFGPVLHRLTFGQAIDQNLLSDYQVVVVGIDDSTYQDMVSQRRIVETETGLQSDAQSLACHVGLAKAIGKYDLRRVITFHSRVNLASKFASDLSEVIEWIPEQFRPEGEMHSGYVSGAMTTSERNQKLKALAGIEPGQRFVLANARCLSEGVDVPALDGVAFIDPRKSEIDIVQAVGRAIRLSSEKQKGTIVIPVFISDEDDPDAVLNSSEFSKVWKVVNALRAHDDVLGEELDSLRLHLGRGGSIERPSKIVFDIPTTISEEFAAAFDTQLVEATTASWHFWFGLLEAFVNKKGHARVQASLKTTDGYLLGNWVSKQRRGKDKLPPERRARLESLPGWVWGPLEFQWNEGFSHLEAFVNKKGHASVPKRFRTTDGYALGTWVHNQRQGKDKLPPERRARLESLTGWVWGPLEFQWNEGLSHLEAFVDQEGHARVQASLKTTDGYALGTWVHNQRQGKDKLPPERRARLESLPGWQWDPYEFQWNEGFSHLEAFVNKKGHARVPRSLTTTDGYALGTWVGTQRSGKDKLPPERRARLESLPGWVWDPLEFQWNEGFSHLEAFVNKEGHASVPQGFRTTDGYALGSWVSTQRSGKDKLPPERRARLESLPGWVWGPLEFQWNEGFSHLEAFVNKKGHASVPKRFRTTDGYALGTWVHNQRQGKDKLPPERRARLESLTGWVWKVI